MVASGAFTRSTAEWEMSRSCQSAMFSSAGVTVARISRASPVRFSDSTGLRLCGMAEEPFCPGAEIFLGLANFAALQMADLDGKVLDRSGDDAQAWRRTSHAGRAE